MATIEEIKQDVEGYNVSSYQNTVEIEKFEARIEEIELNQQNITENSKSISQNTNNIESAMTEIGRRFKCKSSYGGESCNECAPEHYGYPECKSKF